MGEMKTKAQTYNFVRSVKGGVGKTTLSVLLAHYMEQMKASSGRDPEVDGKIMILDLDLQGTAMKKLFYGVQKEPENYVYLDQMIMNQEEVSEEACKNELGSAAHSIHALFSNDSMETKLLYRAGAKNKYSSAVSYDLFRRGVWRVLQQMEDKEYRHFIFDMSPNFDGFGSAGMETICKERKESEGSDQNMIVNMFFVTGMDEGQIMVTIEEVRTMMTHEEYFFYDNLFIVFNDLLKLDDSKTRKEIEKLQEKITAKLSFEGIKEADWNHIFFMYMPFNDDYAWFNRKGNGLRNFRVSEEEDDEDDGESDAITIDKVLSKPPQTQIWDAAGKVIYGDGKFGERKLLELMCQRNG